MVVTAGKKGRLRVLICALAIVLGALSTRSQSPLQNDLPSKAAAVAQAKAIVKRARTTAGIEAVSGGLQTLSFTAKSQRVSRYVSVQSPTKVIEKEKTLSGKIEADCWLPDKFRMKMKGATLNGFGYSYTDILNGEEAWRVPPMSVRSFGRDSRVIDVGDIERTLLMQSRTAKQQVAYYVLGWMLQVPNSLQVEMSYAGLYDLEGRPQDVILAEGTEGYRILMMFDRQTHLLSALASGFYDSFRETVIVETASFDPRFTRATFARARDERQRRTQPPKQHEVLWLFSDYRQVSGITLPHRRTIKFDGQVVEEMTVNEFKINLPGNPKKFEGKPEVKYAPPETLPGRVGPMRNPPIVRFRDGVIP